MDEKQKIKNLKDLEYNHILNKQNIALVLIGTAIIIFTFFCFLIININILTAFLNLFHHPLPNSKLF